jgi:hypothetical protein
MKQVAVTDLSTYLTLGATNIDDLSDGKLAGTNFTGSMILGHQTTGTLNAAQYNTAVGLTALDAITTGDINTAIGYDALTANTTGGHNTASGSEALSLNTTGAGNTASGSEALKLNTTGTYNTAIGSEALEANTTASYNTASGSEALKANTTGASNTASGSEALLSNTTGSYNTASGSEALKANTTGARNTASGTYALYASTTGSYNTASGYYALGSNTTGDRNIAIGYGAYDGADTEDDNLAIGYDALGGSVAGGEYNVAIGNYALDALTSADYNTAVGYNALTDIAAGGNNTAVGYDAGANVGTGSGNVFFGKEAGDATTGGLNNVVIGYGADVSTGNAVNQIVIGKGATGQGDNKAVIGDNDITNVYMSQDAGATVHAGGLNLGGTAVTSTAAEINIIDGSATTQASVTLTGTDGIVISDGDVMKQALVSDIKTYISSNTYPFILAELDANQNTQVDQSLVSESPIGLNTTELVKIGSIFTINASDYIQTSEAGYYEVSVNGTWFKDEVNTKYLMFQVQKSSDGSSWTDVPGGKFVALGTNSNHDYATAFGTTAVQLSADDMIRVTVVQNSVTGSNYTLYLVSTGYNGGSSSSNPGDTTIMMKKIG